MILKLLYEQVNELVLKYCCDSKFITTISVFPIKNEIFKYTSKIQSTISLDIHYYKEGTIIKCFSKYIKTFDDVVDLENELPLFVKECEELHQKYSSQATN